MQFRKASLFLLLSFFPVFISAQDPVNNDSTDKKNGFVTDDPVLSMLDSLANLKIFADRISLNSSNGSSRSNTGSDIIYFSDSVIRERITNLSLQSPFEYVYNDQVKDFINLYAYRKRGLTERILGLSQVYFPLFEEQLDKYNMPLELKYLAVIESALNPIANSSAGAKGLWQFMYGTGKVYGLKVSSYVDDRFDPIKSTIAACEHLQDLYDIYGNWSLALAAYNSGAGNVNKAIRRAGGAKNFWIIQKFLPRETRSYVPAFIAASYVLNYSEEHRIFPVDPGIIHYEIDTVLVKKPLTFEQLSEMFNISRDEIQFLNPAYKQGVIPALPDNPYILRLRKKYIADFINNEEALYAYKTRKGMARDSLLALAVLSQRETMEYRVKKGETASSIAKKFRMTTAELKSLNNLKSSSVKPKQRLLVYSGPPKSKVTESPVSTYVPIPDTAIKQSIPDDRKKESSPVYHVVKSGESLGRIASKYGCTVNNIMEWNSLKSTTIRIGQKLKVAPAGGEIASASAPVSKPPAAATSSAAKKTNGVKYIWHTIQPGDNLWDIAEKYDGVTVADIKKLNNITNAKKLKVGQKIKVKRVN